MVTKFTQWMLRQNCRCRTFSEEQKEYYKILVDFAKEQTKGLENESK